MEHDGDFVPELALIGAGLYAVNADAGSFDAMLGWLRRRGALPDPWIVSDTDCLVWARACQAAEHVRQVQDILGSRATMETPADHVLKELKAIDDANPGVSVPPFWLVVPRDLADHAKALGPIVQLGRWGSDQQAPTSRD